jgi:Ca2+-binding EF-hand superfamily protein
MNDEERENLIENVLSNLTQEDIKFYNNILIELTNKNHPFEDNELYDLFDKLDIEGTNSIKFQKIINLLCLLRTEVNSFYVDKIITEFSKEKADEISRDNFVSKMKIGMTINDQNIGEVEDIFNILDTDHDGVLGYQDINTIMNALGEDMFDDATSKSLITLFKNKDITQYDGITIEKFKELFQNEP